MDIFFAVNDGYAQHLCVAMNSIAKNNEFDIINFYVLTNNFSQQNKDKIAKSLSKYDYCNIKYFIVDDERLKKLKLNISHISIQTYYRYLISELFPKLEKAIYLDADLIVNADLYSLWHMKIDDFYIAGVKDKYISDSGYAKRLGFSNDNLYINAGVLLLNLKKMREDNITDKLIENTIKYADIIEYQDQDILNITCKNKIKEISERYNFTSDNVKCSSQEEIDQLNPAIIHYTGQTKPWHCGCKNKLKKLYFKYLKSTEYKYFWFKHIFNRQWKKKDSRIKVGLIIDEFFGGANTAYGGYGFLARKYIAKYIPNENIKVDVLLGKSENKYFPQKFHEDNVDLYRLPKKPWFAKLWLKKKSYDIYLSIELTSDFVLKNETNPNKKLILWIQDPRPWADWREINTVNLWREPCYWNSQAYELVNNFYKKNRVRFISQGYFLNEKAKDLYRLNDDVPIQYLPNPMEVDNNFNLSKYNKKNNIIFLGRIESVKRGWLFCEIAQKLPQYEFYVLGQTFREKEKSSNIFDKYKNIKNLHFMGHVEGKEKEQYLKDAKILVNTSIHEALPISFLEALAYGTLLVSGRNPENLTSKFGIYTGQVLGDGFDKVDLFVNAIKQLIENDTERNVLAQEAIDYVKRVHNVNSFVADLRNVIYEELK